MTKLRVPRRVGLVLVLLLSQGAGGDTGDALDPVRLLDAVLDVAPTPSAVAVSPASQKMLIGETLALAATSDDPLDSFLWNTSDLTVATVDAAGVVTAVALGTATITATGTNSGLIDTTTIDVVSAIIDVTPASPTVLVGGNVTLSATSTDASDTFSWTSSDTGIATVDSGSGTVRGEKAGSATITAVGSNSGESGAATVTVTSPTITLGLGDCFITALLADTRFQVALAPIRSLRDNVLLHSAPGCAIADAYYRLSPAATRLLRRVR